MRKPADIRVITISSGKGRGGSERFSAALGLSGMNAAPIKLIHRQKWDDYRFEAETSQGGAGRGGMTGKKGGGGWS